MEVDWMKQIQIEDQKKDSFLVEDFVEDCELRGMTKESAYGYKSNLRIFKKFLDRERASLKEANRYHLKKFLNYLRKERGNSQKRVENYFTSLSTFYDYLVYEGVVTNNPILPFRKRYIRSYKKNSEPSHQRKLISIEEMSMLINSIMNIRDKAMLALLAKTGIRKGELTRIDLEDINWEEQSILLKPRAKRSNRLVFFDDECASVLKRWISVRSKFSPATNALFVSQTGNRLDKNAPGNAVNKWAEKVGLHNSKSKRMEDHFTPHCCRHWFTTWLPSSSRPRSRHWLSLSFLPS
jgi:integrase/recombinase XerD